MKKFLVTTLPGLEIYLAKELQDAEIIYNGRVNTSHAATTCRLGIYIIEIHAQFKFNNFNDIISKNIDLPFNQVTCKRMGEHPFTSQNVRDAFMKKSTDSNNTCFIDIIDELCTIGLLINKKKLSSRSYHMHIHSGSVPPLIAAAALAISEYTPKKSLCDPFCRDGVILIEAGILGGKELTGIDKKNSIRNAKINAEVAEVNINLNIGDYKNMPSCDQVVTKPFEFTSKVKADKTAGKLKEFLIMTQVKQVESLTLIMNHPGKIKDIALECGFLVKRTAVISSGQLQWYITVLHPKTAILGVFDKKL